MASLQSGKPASAPVPLPSPSQFGVPLRGRGVVDGAIRRRILHFTFDDGPDAKLTPTLLDELDRVGWKATFFFSTSRFTGRERRNAKAPDLAREVARRGHQLGAHGFDHLHMAPMSPPQLTFQVAQSEAMFQRVFGTRTFLFRAPFGSRNAALDRMLSDGAYVTTMWNIGMADWVERTPEMIEQTFWRVLARNEAQSGDRGGVVLLHDTHAWSVAAFGLIADAILARNCALLGAGEELYDVADSLAPWTSPIPDDVYAARQASLREGTAARCTHSRDGRSASAFTRTGAHAMFRGRQ
jgi:peptidoglycan/xylan/chitin deacetylase (PgdA/CDA1 family)